MKTFYVYILCNKKRGTLYIGVTNDLVRRLAEHKCQSPDSFTGKHQVTQLVFFDEHESPILAIQREKQLKKWRRQWKINLIEKMNPEWEDLGFYILPDHS